MAITGVVPRRILLSHKLYCQFEYLDLFTNNLYFPMTKNTLRSLLSKRVNQSTHSLAEVSSRAPCAKILWSLPKRDTDQQRILAHAKPI